MSLLLLLLAGQVTAGADLNSTVNTKARSRDVMAIFGACLAKKRPELAQEYVLNSLSNARDKLFSTGTASYCMPYGTQMKFQPIAARGSMAEFLIRKEVPAFPALRLEGVAAVATDSPTIIMFEGRSKEAGPPTLTADQKLMLTRASNDQVVALGECMIRADQAKSRDLLRSKFNSPDERAAVQGLVQVIQKCVLAGQQLRIDASGVRTAVAVAYYRLLHAPQGGPQ